MHRLSHLIAPLTLIATTGISAVCLANVPTPPMASPSASTPIGAAFTVDTDRPNNSTYVLGEPVTLHFSASGLAPLAATTLSITVLDEFGATVSTHSLLLTGDSSGKASIAYIAPAAEYGYYRVEATLPNGATISGLGTRAAGFITYAIIPDPAARVNYGDAGSRFGFCGGFSSAQGNLLQLLGATYLLDGPGWSVLEPDYAGQFAHDRAEAVAKGEVYPFHIANNHAAWPTYAIAVVMATAEPTWAFVPGSGTPSLPTMGVLNAAGQGGFAGYSKERALVGAEDFSAQSSRYYQITWEPEVPAGFGGTPAQLVEFFRQAYPAIHAADPKGIVMGPTMLPIDDTSLAPLYAAGLADYIDAVSVHTYSHWPAETHGLVSEIRAQMSMAATAKGHSMPFISTEHGLVSGAGSVFSTGGELNQALGNIRNTLIDLGEGFKIDFSFYIADFWSKSASETANTFGYYWNLDPKIAFGTDKVGPKPSVPAYATMTNLLDGTKTIGTVAEVTGTQLGYRFQRGTTTILALWDYAAAASVVSIPVTNDVPKICDWMGRCHAVAPTNGHLRVHLSAAPTYVIGENL